jgi:hypothetical protein
VAEVQGTCDKRFDAVRVALAESLDDADVGASAAVFVDGEPVADLWGGYQDAKRTEPWEQDTITNVWSTTKTMLALSALILADRGDLDLDAPVASYWPDTTRSPRGFSSARLSAGSPASPWLPSSRSTSRNRSAPTSTSPCPQGPGSTSASRRPSPRPMRRTAT